MTLLYAVLEAEPCVISLIEFSGGSISGSFRVYLVASFSCVVMPAGASHLQKESEFHVFVNCREEIFPRVIEFSPDIIFISAGFDAHKKDTLNAGYIALVSVAQYFSPYLATASLIALPSHLIFRSRKTLIG